MRTAYGGRGYGHRDNKIAYDQQLIRFYTITKKCDPDNKYKLMRNITIAIGRNLKKIFGCSTFSKQVADGDISAAFLKEIVDVALDAHSYNKITERIRYGAFFFDHEEKKEVTYNFESDDSYD